MYYYHSPTAMPMDLGAQVVDALPSPTNVVSYSLPTAMPVPHVPSAWDPSPYLQSLPIYRAAIRRSLSVVTSLKHVGGQIPLIRSAVENYINPDAFVKQTRTVSESPSVAVPFDTSGIAVYGLALCLVLGIGAAIWLVCTRANHAPGPSTFATNVSSLASSSSTTSLETNTVASGSNSVMVLASASTSTLASSSTDTSLVTMSDLDDTDEALINALPAPVAPVVTTTRTASGPRRGRKWVRMPTD